MVHGVKRVKDEPRADIQVQGLGPLNGGGDTTTIGPTRFWLPPSTAFHSQAQSMFDFTINALQTEIFILRVEHINPNAKTVTLQVCVIFGKPNVG